MAKAKRWWVWFSGWPGQELWVDTAFKTEADALKYICKELGYPRHWKKWRGVLKESDQYIASDQSDLRFGLWRGAK